MIPLPFASRASERSKGQSLDPINTDAVPVSVPGRAFVCPGRADREADVRAVTVSFLDRDGGDHWAASGHDLHLLRADGLSSDGE